MTRPGTDSLRAYDLRTEYLHDPVGIDVTVPPNTTASVHVPAGDPLNVEEVLARGEGVRFAGEDDGRAVFEIGSGVYRFISDGVGSSAR